MNGWSIDKVDTNIWNVFRGRQRRGYIAVLKTGELSGQVKVEVSDNITGHEAISLVQDMIYHEIAEEELLMDN